MEKYCPRANSSHNNVTFCSISPEWLLTTARLITPADKSEMSCVQPLHRLQSGSTHLFFLFHFTFNIYGQVEVFLSTANISKMVINITNVNIAVQ